MFKIKTKDLKFVSKFKDHVCFHHLDKMGIVFYGNYLSFFSSARLYAFEEIFGVPYGIPDGFEDEFGLHWPVAEARIKYCKSLKMSKNPIYILTWMAIKKTSTVTVQELFHEEELIAVNVECNVFARQDKYGDLTTEVIPMRLRDSFEKFESTPLFHQKETKSLLI